MVAPVIPFGRRPPSAFCLQKKKAKRHGFQPRQRGPDVTFHMGAGCLGSPETWVPPCLVSSLWVCVISSCLG
ncbi:hypothetical protein P168DRAFT_58420 [Aspergillus campestris IBT 28561]|uniref:Uncharacterized protein n=1 Tax=Aspergillus campestris (strain IBT 28561) TaxID=1392248 RepID=A0A2I1CTT7_ASPC2|nr:uncharacterized protein P168DRAFT_58420 [Aspergillus campestris IBT 28561]PKY01046.1 hypothetical protein P168DRAFT_58420 [Aspergillus campestris IBT 28561]